MGWLLLGLLGLVATTGDDGPSGGAATPDDDTIALSCDDAIDMLPEATRAPLAEAIAHGVDPVAIHAMANELRQAADFEDGTTSAGRHMRAAMIIVAHCLDARAAGLSDTYQPPAGLPLAGLASASLAGPVVYTAPGARSVGYREPQL